MISKDEARTRVRLKREIRMRLIVVGIPSRSALIRSLADMSTPELRSLLRRLRRF